ncbi:MAG: tetratricopeptide repeat protein [Terriglobia bacterium]
MTMDLHENIRVTSPISGTLHEDALKAWKNKKYKEAIILYERLANNGSAEAMLILAKFYLGDGSVVTRDPKRSREWAEKALESGWTPEVALFLGHLYYSGECYGPDYKSAYKIYKRFENKNEKFTLDDARGIFRLGVMYELGRGVEKDFQKAEESYRKSAKIGNIHARKNLAVLNLKQGNWIKGYMLWIGAIIRGWLCIICTPHSRKILP